YLKINEVKMFSDFDFSLLDDPDFKEDAVREELVLPIIKALGYSATGDSRIIRSKSLVHPYVAIGSQQRKISIVPDYMFMSDSSPYWILDAKSPSESILKSKHVEQAYSYAIHPEVRAPLYALCNGREFVLFDIKKFDPILHFKLTDIETYWDQLFRILNPDVRANPELLDYHPDYGIFVRKLGAVDGFKFIATSVHANFMCKVADDEYTTMIVVNGDVDCLVSLYFNKVQYEQLLSLQEVSVRKIIEESLSQFPYYVSLENLGKEIKFGVASTLSNQILSNAEESYIPFIVDEFMPYVVL
ncbi:TPA: hypothetical protein ACYHOF_003407, partial [Vibrio cholerae]